MVEGLSNVQQLEIPFEEEVGKKYPIMKGDLDGKIIIQVPKDMTHFSVQNLQKAIESNEQFLDWKNKGVIIVTENIKFFRCHRIRKAELDKLKNA